MKSALLPTKQEFTMTAPFSRTTIWLQALLSCQFQKTTSLRMFPRKCRVLCSLDTHLLCRYKQVRAIMIDMVLATDFSKHLELLGQFKSRRAAGSTNLRRIVLTVPRFPNRQTGRQSVDAKNGSQVRRYWAHYQIA